MNELLGISMFLSLVGVMNSSPLFLGLVILASAVVFSVVGGIYLGSFWFSYVLILVYVGGLMVLFIYIASLAANELMYFYKITFIFFVSFGFILFNKSLSVNIHDHDIMMPSKFDYAGLYNMYGGGNYDITMFLAFYLLLTLMGVVKMTQLYKGPLRQMN